MVEEKVEIKAPEVVEEVVYKPTKKNVIIKKAPKRVVEQKVVVKEKNSFNPYKKKNVNYRL